LLGDLGQARRHGRLDERLRLPLTNLQQCTAAHAAGLDIAVGGTARDDRDVDVPVVDHVADKLAATFATYGRSTGHPLGSRI
jgi:hypothetical protein